jgi:hypothetical protein
MAGKSTLAELREMNVAKQREAAGGGTATAVEEPPAEPPIQIDRQIDGQTDSNLVSHASGRTSVQTAVQPDGEADRQAGSRPDRKVGGSTAATRRAAAEEAKVLAGTMMKTSGLKIAVGLDEFLDDLQYELKKKGKRVDKQQLLSYALQGLYVKVKTGGSVDEID